MDSKAYSPEKIDSMIPAVTAEPFVEEDLMDQQDEIVKRYWQEVFSQEPLPTFQVSEFNIATGKQGQFKIFSPSTKAADEYKFTLFDPDGTPISHATFTKEIIERIKAGDTSVIIRLLPYSTNSGVCVLTYAADHQSVKMKDTKINKFEERVIKARQHSNKTMQDQGMTQKKC